MTISSPFNRSATPTVKGLVTLASEPVAFPFAAGFTNWGGGYSPCTYFKHGFEVALAGTIFADGSSTLMGTLPIGFRPQALKNFTGVSGAATVWNFQIQPSGQVIMLAISAAIFSLEQVRFDVRT